MPKQQVDLSTRVALRAVSTLYKVRQRVRDTIPLGPMKVQLTPRQALDQINTMSPIERSELAKMVGVDEFLRAIDDLRQKAGQ